MNHSAPPDLSVVIPMLNEAARLSDGVGTILGHLNERFPGSEVILVDDGSVDSTSDRAGELARHFNNLSVKVIRFKENRGKGKAVREGMRHVTGAVRIFADADNATPIEELDRLLPLVKTETTVVIGSRALDRSLLERRQPWWRDLMGRTFNLMLRTVVGLPFRDTQCGFKLFGKRAAEECFGRQTIERFAFDVELLWIARRLGFEILEAPVRWRHVPDSRVSPLWDSLSMAKDALCVRWRTRKIAR